MPPAREVAAEEADGSQILDLESWRTGCEVEQTEGSQK